MKITFIYESLRLHSIKYKNRARRRSSLEAAVIEDRRQNSASGGAISGANIFAGILFGAIGLGAFIYGKKNTLWRPMALGVALMALPYFPLGNWAVYLIGATLTVALFLWR